MLVKPIRFATQKGTLAMGDFRHDGGIMHMSTL